MKGIYVMILRLNNNMDMTIGKLAKFHFKAGYYYYVGSALGMGGFRRVIRHFNVASGKNSARKWHIDHLLPYSEVICAVLLPTDETIECEVARTFPGYSEPIPGFGCSDCTCKSHLFFCDRNFTDDILKTAGKLTGNESIIIYPGM